jgi:hypothetical protein
VPEFAGRFPRDQGPPAVLGASRLFVLLVAARRWVLAGNTYSMLSGIDELCMHVCSYHWILLKIQFDKSRVEIMDSFDKAKALWSDMKAMLQK